MKATQLLTTTFFFVCLACGDDGASSDANVPADSSASDASTSDASGPDTSISDAGGDGTDMVDVGSPPRDAAPENPALVFPGSNTRLLQGLGVREVG